MLFETFDYNPPPVERVREILLGDSTIKIDGHFDERVSLFINKGLAEELRTVPLVDLSG